MKDGQPEIPVLIVDDKEENLTVARLLLESIGFKVKEAKNGKTAVEICKKWKPKIVLMDIVMPVMDGKEATKRIRALEGGSDISIIALSASAMEEEREEVIGYGADAFLSKPFRESELLEEIRIHANIEYEYENVQEEPISESTGLNPEEISKLPIELRNSLIQAAQIGDIDKLLEIVQEISVTNKEISDYLHGLIEEYKLEQILNII